MATASDIGMKYRFLGDSGLLVSAFSFGCMTFTKEEDADNAYELLAHAYKHGINFWDTAELYANGARARRTEQKGLSRKHLVEGVKASHKRLGVDYVDVLFCHRPEPFTPIEEVVRATNFIINQGWAFYWGTSEWSENDILQACEIADRLGLIRPIVEQPQYNLFFRSKVEVEFKALYEKYKLGLTVWSPLAFGILTGKYANGVPEDTRLADEAWASVFGKVSDRAAQTEKFRPIAKELDCSLAQLAIAWCELNQNVSTVMLGAKTVKQLDENLMAWPVVAKITPEIKQKIAEIIPFVYTAPSYDAYCKLRANYL